MRDHDIDCGVYEGYACTCRNRRGGWVAPLQGAQFTALASAVGPGSVQTGTLAGESAGDAGGGDSGGSI